MIRTDAMVGFTAIPYLRAVVWRPGTPCVLRCSGFVSAMLSAWLRTRLNREALSLYGNLIAKFAATNSRASRYSAINAMPARAV